MIPMLDLCYAIDRDVTHHNPPNYSAGHQVTWMLKVGYLRASGLGEARCDNKTCSSGDSLQPLISERRPHSFKASCIGGCNPRANRLLLLHDPNGIGKWYKNLHSTDQT